ncbi:MAG: hypothetical protein O3B08_09175 [Proteobacteria bacterium]|nr:hypothetical protein [Pseudomonadota bacterium]
MRNGSYTIALTLNFMPIAKKAALERNNFVSSLLIEQSNAHKRISPIVDITNYARKSGTAIMPSRTGGAFNMAQSMALVTSFSIGAII